MDLIILHLRLYSVALSRGFGATLRPQGISYLKTLAWNLSVSAISAGSGGRIPRTTIFLGIARNWDAEFKYTSLFLNHYHPLLQRPAPLTLVVGARSTFGLSDSL